MSSNFASSGGYAKKILRLLGLKPAISTAEVADIAGSLAKERYAFQRSLRGPESAGIIEKYDSGQQLYTRLTREGKKKLHSINLENDQGLFNPAWDGKWRIVVLDIPEAQKNERDSLRYLLKKAGFVCLKSSVWISPFPYEYLFENIKKDLGLSTEIMIFVTDKIDAETEKAFFTTFSK